MMHKIWNFIGDIRLSFWLLLASAAVFFIGMFYSSYHYAYFRAMNELRIQDWLARELPSRPDLNWWLPALLAALALLGVNTVVCTINRLREIAAGSQKKDHRFVLALLPSIVHILFITVMIGHAVTIIAGSWTRVPLREGGQVTIDRALPPLTVTRIADIYFPEDSRLAKRIKQTEVTLAGRDGETVRVSYLESVRYHGYRLHLDMVKQKQGGAHINRHVRPADDRETCNRAETFRSKERKREPGQMVQLLVISDPGLPVIITGFTLILAVMAWYFTGTMLKRNGA